MSLLAWYPLNGDTKDYSGNNRHMKSDAAVINNQGKIGQSYYFDNAVLYNDGWNLKTDKAYSNFTVCAWVYPTESPADVNGRNIISFGCNSAIRFRLTQENGLWVLWGGPGSTSFTTTVYNGKIALNQWTHICYRLENSLMSLYLNGKKVSLTSNPKKDIYMDSFNFVIGGYNKRNTDTLVPEPWKGKLNDIRLYDEALTAMQIKEIAQAKICHYTCNEQMYENTKNLFNNKIQLGDNGVNEKRWLGDHDIEFSVEQGSRYMGLRFNEQIKLKAYTTYTLSFKLKKIAGTLKMIRGHMATLNHVSLSINGKKEGNYQDGKLIDDTFDILNIEVVFTPKENILDLNGVFIQPNALQDEYVKVRIWDIQVEEKDHATPFTPNTRVATLKDISGFGYDMTSPVEYSPTWKNDEKKSYFELKDKANFYVNKPFSSFLFNFTLSCWIKTNDDEALCLLGTNTGNNSDFAIGINNGKACLHTYTITSPNEGDANYAKSNTSINDNSWHLVSITYDETTIKTYIDGKLENQQNAKFIFKNSSSDCLSISMKNINDFGDYENRRYTGCIRDARVYATALSDEDIKLLYQPEIIIDKANVIRCSEINESFKTIKKHIEIKSKGLELKADAKVIIDNYTRIIDTIGWEVIEIKKDNTINVTPFSTHASNDKFVDLMNYIKQLDKHSIIILATKDQPSSNPNMNANNSCISFVNYLNSIGSSMTKDFPFRGAYAGIIYNGQIVKEEISYEGVNSSAEIILDELLIDSAILNKETFNGFNKDATLNFNEFIEADDQEVTINKDNALTAKEFKEIY